MDTRARHEARDFRAARLAVGGWPGLLRLGVQESLRTVRDYLEEIRRDPEKVGRLLRSLARNVSSYAAATTLAVDAGGSEGALDDDTVRDTSIRCID